ALLTQRQNGFGTAQVDNDVAALKAPHDTGDQLALAVFVLGINDITLRVADALDDDLLGSLRCNAAKATAIGFEMQDVAVHLVLLTRRSRVLVEEVDGENHLVVRFD